MGKRGPKKEYSTRQPVTIRLDPAAKRLFQEYGDREYWRMILESMILTRAELEQGKIDPADFALIAGARTAQVTGIPSKDETEDEKD